MFGFLFGFSQSSDYGERLNVLFKVSGSEESFKVAITQTIALIKDQYPAITDDIWDRMESEFLTTSLSDLTTMLIPVYEKHLTIDDLNSIIAFYESRQVRSMHRKLL